MRRSEYLVFAGFLGAIAAVVGTTPAVACLNCSLSVEGVGFTAQQSAFVGMNGVQANLQNIRDRIQETPTVGSGVLRYNSDPYDEDADLFSPVPLAYANTKDGSTNLLYKAPPMAPVSPIRYAAWGNGFDDNEWRNATVAGAALSRNTSTVGGIGGADAVITGIASKTDALVLGFLVGDTSSWVNANDGSTAQVNGPGVGFYAAYVNGGASVDTSFKVDFFDISAAAPGAAALALGLTNYASATNFNYKFQNVIGAWWVEPTVGFAYTSTDWNAASHAAGLVDGTDTRLQAGVRVGTSTTWNGMPVTPTLLFRLYDDVSITGGTVAAVVAPALPTGQGLVFADAIGRLDVGVTSSLSTFLQGELRGSTGVFGAGVSGGFRYKLN